ncbi:MAG: ATP-binding protein [Christensenellaceae bacterium]
MKRSASGKAFLGSLFFFLTVSVVTMVSLFAFLYVNERAQGNKAVIALVMFLVILFLSLLCTLIDYFRRKFTVDEPTRQILQATERIARGDFSVRLTPVHTYARYSEFDRIMLNLNAMTAELQKSEMMKSDFVSNVSHELKTPLGVIRNAVTMSECTQDPAVRAEYIRIATETVDKLSLLVSNILKLDRLEHQNLFVEKKSFDLSGALEEAIVSLEDQIEEKELTIEAEVGEVVFNSSKEYLDIVWLNLLTNAVKFTERGGTIGVKVHRSKGKVSVAISDTGCGIDPETGKHIFDKFYQGDTSHAKEGNGLGLALVKRVIDVLGGEISAFSEVGKGTTFTVTLKE